MVDRQVLRDELNKARYILAEGMFDMLTIAIDEMDERGVFLLDGRVMKIRPESIVGLRERMLH